MKNILFILIFFSNSALANNKVNDRAIESINVNTHGRVNIVVSGEAINPADCKNTALVIDPDVPARRDWVALLLTAKSSGSTVDILVAPAEGDCANPNSSNPNGRNPRIINITINN